MGLGRNGDQFANALWFSRGNPFNTAGLQAHQPLSVQNFVLVHVTGEQGAAEPLYVLERVCWEVRWCVVVVVSYVKGMAGVLVLV